MEIYYHRALIHQVVYYYLKVDCDNLKLLIVNLKSSYEKNKYS